MDYYFFRIFSGAIMKRLSLAVWLAALCGFTHAGWERIVKNDSGDIYVDVATLQRQGNQSTMISLSNLGPRKAASENEPAWFKSITQLDEYDCALRRIRLISFSLFPEAMGGGKLVSTSNKVTPWIAIDGGSWNERKWNVACSKSHIQ